MKSIIQQCFSLAASVLLLTVPQFANSDIIPVTGSDLTGSRSTSNATLDAGGGWVNSQDGFKVAWNISEIGNNYHYVYTISDKNGSSLTPGLSHFILEVSSNINSSNIKQIIFNASPNFENGDPTIYNSTNQGNSNPGIPGNLYGIKFETPGNGVQTISFDSSRIPVWGDFYAKGGSSSFAYNPGFGTDPSANSASFTAWIPTPDSVNISVPEPSTYLMMGSLLIAALLLSQRKQGLAQKVRR